MHNGREKADMHMHVRCWMSALQWCALARLSSTAQHQIASPSMCCTHAAVSRAYACLSDPDKRANYDRYGHEDPSQLGRRGGPGAGHGMYQPDGFDPNEIFNMFFGGGGFGGGGGNFGPRWGTPGCGLRWQPCNRGSDTVMRGDMH